MRRYIESALRLRVRIILSALLVFALASVALFFSKQGYSSAATIWVEKPPYYTNEQLGWNPYLSPAANQAGKFGELLRTQDFTLRIARAAGLPMTTVAEQGRVLTDLQDNLSVVDFGERLIKVTYTSSRPEYTEPVVRQAIKIFGDEITEGTQRLNESSRELAQVDLEAARKDMEKSKRELDEFIRANPEVNEANAPANPTYRALSLQFATDSDRVDQAENKINAIDSRIRSDSQLIESIWRMRDQPEAAEPYRLTLKDLLKNSLVAGGMALLAAFAIILVGTWTDAAVYTLNDVTTVALAGNDGANSELLVGLVPYIAPLGAIRKQAAKEERALRKRGGKPSVRVVDDTDIVPRTGPEPNIKRPSDALAQR